MLTDIRTLRAPLALLAAVLLVALLAFLIIESSAVKNEYHVAHAERMRALETADSDINAVIENVQNTFEQGEGMPLSIDLAFARLVDSNQALQDFSNVPRLAPEVASKLAAYDNELSQFIGNGRAFAAGQTVLAEALQTFQEVSPTLVKDLRDGGLPSQTQNAFSLALDIIEFSTGQAVLDPDQLAVRLQELRDDPRLDSRTTESVNAFAGAATSVIAEHAATAANLAAVTNGGAKAALAELNYAIVADNRRTVQRAERARALLALCAVLLLLAAGYALLRLQSSYQKLNQLNATLEQSNVTLEQHVQARTEQLSSAYDELKESQLQLVQAEKMSSLGEMVAGISHEINTPLWYLMSNSSVIQERLDIASELCDVAESMLTGIRTRSSLKESLRRGLQDMHRLMKRGMKEDIEEAKDLVQDSIDGLDELTTLAQGLKDFSRLDRARNGKFNVNEGLDKTLLIVRNKIKHKATVHKHYGDVPAILCSPSQVNQIFLNLITNAADSLTEDGEIVLHTWAENDCVEISISDTGSGIPEDILPRIRDPFFTTKDVGDGTGLGLSIVDQIVAAHGGKLQIDSMPGKGTTVTVTLPILAPGLFPVDGHPEEDAADVADITTAFSEQNAA